jgi:hypothetical protein
MHRSAWVLCLLLLSACASAVLPLDGGREVDASVSDVDAGPADAGELDAGPVDAGTKYEYCATSFGNALTAAFGRVDGIVLAVVPRGVTTCGPINGDHVVVHLQNDAGVYRMVVNVMSSAADPHVASAAIDGGALPTPFEPGWHPGLTLDYPTTFGLHVDAGVWEVLDPDTAAARVYDAIEVGAPLSVYATSSGGTYADSAHLIHRHGNHDDGALVLNPTSAAPTWVLFHFLTQTF